MQIIYAVGHLPLVVGRNQQGRYGEDVYVEKEERLSNMGFADRPMFSVSKDPPSPNLRKATVGKARLRRTGRQQEWSTPKTKDKRKKIKVKQLSGFNALAAK
mgnify:CR=1 FL=1